MKIWKLVINEVSPDPSVCVSSYIAPRKTRANEFYLKRESADKRRDEIYDGVQKLLGYLPKVEVLIQEITVIEE